MLQQRRKGWAFKYKGHKQRTRDEPWFAGTIHAAHMLAVDCGLTICIRTRSIVSDVHPSAPHAFSTALLLSGASRNLVMAS
jgi:hypothetical protein